MSRLLALLLLTGCWPQIPGQWSDYDTGSTTDTDVDTTDTDTDAAALGSVTVVHYPADAQYPEFTVASAVFPDHRGGLADPAACSTSDGLCAPSWPSVTDPVLEYDQTSMGNELSDAVFYSVGDTVEVVDSTLYANVSGSRIWYEDQIPVYPTADDYRSSWPGADLPAWTSESAGDLAAELHVSAPATDTPLTRGPQGTIDFTWRGDEQGDVYLEIHSGRGTIYAMALSDTGSYTLDLADFDLAQDTPLVLRLSRRTRVDRSFNDYPLQLTAWDEQWFYLTVSEEGG